MSLPAVDVRDLLGHPGASREERVRGTLEGLGTELARVREDGPLVCELLLESVVEGILVSGRLTGTLALSCARCLKDFEQGFAVDVSELFVERPDEDDETYPLGADGALEVEQLARDAVGVELPFSPLCRPDCRGLCPVCGGDRNLGECPGDHPETDRRWAGLEGLLEQLDPN